MLTLLPPPPIADPVPAAPPPHPQPVVAGRGSARRARLAPGSTRRWSLVASVAVHVVLGAALWHRAHARPPTLDGFVAIGSACEVSAPSDELAPSEELASPDATAPSPLDAPLPPVFDAVDLVRPIDPMPNVDEPLLSDVARATEPTPIDVPGPLDPTLRVPRRRAPPLTAAAPPPPATARVALPTTRPTEAMASRAPGIVTGPTGYGGNVPPPYPPEAAARGETGDVVLRIAVDVDGRVLEVDVVRSSGFAALDTAARTAALAWRFRPATRDGAPIRGTVVQRVRFGG